VLDEGKVLATGTSDEIIAAMPGTLRSATARPQGPRAWRRGGQWRVWDPDGTVGDIQADLQDAVTVAAIAREVGA
jgi:ABC-2 type transport system ATP-binding protein